jgi:hypothetical protein
MFHVEILFFRSIREPSCPAYEAFLKNVKDVFRKNRLGHLPLFSRRPFPSARFSTPGGRTSATMCFKLLAERGIIGLVQKFQVFFHVATESPETLYRVFSRGPIHLFHQESLQKKGPPLWKRQNIWKKFPESEKIGVSFFRAEKVPAIFFFI